MRLKCGFQEARVLKTLLVPIHTSICTLICSETSAQYAFDLSRLLGSRVILFHVLEPNETPEQARAVLDALASKSRFMPQKIVQPPKNPSLSSDILDWATLEQADLIVLGIPDQPAFNPIISEIISHSRIPVQLIPQSTRAAPIRYLEQLGHHLEQPI
jgi:hypothetical protein